MKKNDNPYWQIAIVSIVAIVGITMIFFIGRAGTIGNPASTLLSTQTSTGSNSNLAGEVYLGDPSPRDLCIEECESACEEDFSCGDGVLDEGEECDTNKLGGKTCRRLGFYKGILKCRGDCTFNTSSCSNCGNKKVQEGEICDKTNLTGETCVSLGFTGGILKCNTNCKSFKTTACEGSSSLPMPIALPQSPASGFNLDDEAFGMEECMDECESACEEEEESICGNGVIDEGEECDMSNLNGKTCATQGYFKGTLSCNADCTFNTTSCSNCGNNILNAGEECENGECIEQENPDLAIDAFLMMNLDNNASIGETATKAVDQSPYRNNGTLFNNTAWTAEGKFGGGARFDGNGDYIQTAANNALDNANVGTVTAWIKTSMSGGMQAIVSYTTASTMSSNYVWRVRNNVLEMGWNYAGSGGNWNLINGTTPLNDGNWHFVAFVSDGISKNKIYVDGVQETVKFTSTGGNTNDKDWTSNIDGVESHNHHINIGGLNRGTTPTNWFNGTIDQVRIWKRALSSEEVMQQFSAGTSACTIGLTCATQGYFKGTLSCNADCTFNTTSCSNCGNNILNAGEECDTSKLNGKTCATQGYYQGTLSCNSSCMIDPSGCHKCGNGIIDSGEQCDGANLGNDCQYLGLGYDEGTPDCSNDCQLTKGTCAKCGNGVREGGESCDGEDLGSRNCGEYAGINKAWTGKPACQSNCVTILPGTCAYCGNNKVDEGEECDGYDMGDIPICLKGTITCNSDCNGFIGKCFQWDYE